MTSNFLLRNRGQMGIQKLQVRKSMSPVLSARGRFVFWGLVAWAPLVVFGQGNFPPQEAEYAIIGALPGEQTRHSLSLNGSGGYLVWQDNRTDGDGLGVSARRLNGTLSGELGVFRVNEQGVGDQENPQVAMLKNGGAVFVWQGGQPGFQKIYARFLTPDGTFTTGDVLVNTYTNNFQINPVVTSLADSNVVVVWASADQDGSLRGVYAQRLSSTGQKLGGEFRINTTTLLNQRDPTVAALTNGGFVVAWICEKEQTNGFDRLEVNARVYNAAGIALTGEIQVNASANGSAQPAAANLADGGFTVVWMQRDANVLTNGWDIWVRAFTGGGGARGAEVLVNAYTYGDQFSPKIASLGLDQMIVWNSMGQDGSWEGVYARSMSAGDLVGDEFPVNATRISRQIQPVVASDDNNRFLVVWSSFIGGESSFDLYAQRYASLQPLLQPPPPYVSALSQSRLSVAWSELSGYALAGYEVYMDGSPFPDFTTNNYWVATRLVPGSVHNFTLVYLMADGQRSRPSDPVTGTTWGEDANFDALPDDWQAVYWGPNPASWPALNVDSDGDGATNLQELLAGTNPRDPNSVLKTWIVSTPQGRLFTWNTQPGLVYQVQVSNNLGTWANRGTPRFAAGTTDSIAVDGSLSVAYYRVLRVW